MCLWYNVRPVHIKAHAWISEKNNKRVAYLKKRYNNKKKFRQRFVDSSLDFSQIEQTDW